MLQVFSEKLQKWSQTWQHDIKDVDWGDDDPGHFVNDNNLEDYLVDDVEEPTEETEETPASTSPKAPTTPTTPGYMDELPTTNEYLTPDAVREVVYQDIEELLSDAMSSEPHETIGFDYTNRHGTYAGWRIVEPHYTFLAYTTGNNILVIWDRDVRDIRAFIIGNIHPNGVRYEGEKFAPKMEIMKGISSV